MPAPSKRPLSSSSSSANKKPKVQQQHASSSSSKPSLKEETKRKVPVTSSSSAKRDALDLEEARIDGEDWKGDDEDEEDDEGIEIDEEENSMDGEEEEEGEEGGEGEEKKAKDPEAVRLARLTQKTDRLARRNAKPNSEILLESKSLWAQLNRKEGSISKKDREAVLQQLMTLLEGRMGAVVNKHDGGRVVQSIVKHGGKKEREAVAVELKGRFVELVQSKYSKFLVAKLIRLAPTARTNILAELMPHLPRLILHREAAGIIEDAFTLWCSGKERSSMMRPWWGKEGGLFYTDTDGKGIKGFIESEQDESRRARVADGIRGHLDNIFNNPEKGAIQHTIVHRLIFDYVTISASLADNEQRRKDLFEDFNELMPEIVHTRDGAFIVRDFLATSGAKDRKQIVKVFKPHVMKMAEDGDAQTVLFTMFDVIDDTKLVGKSIIGELKLLELFESKLGRRVPLYLLTPRSKRHFIPSTIALLAYHDAARALTSKKDPLVRTSELRKAVSPGLVEVIAADLQGALVRDAGASLLVGEVLLYAEDADKLSTISTLVSPLLHKYKQTHTLDPDPSSPSVHTIDLSYASRLYKLLLQGGHHNFATKTIDVVPGSEPFALAFAEAFWNETKRAGTLVEMACGGGTFVVAELIERLKVSESKLVEEVRVVFGAGERARVKESGAKGANVLLEKLESL